ncbi:hypothetical protein ALQ52_04431 [Pseudomonas cannabina pv. alisalensis]|nr:hypothetical protein ALQ52_04431 [Pseudomonas cannabina pv. alisalensis]
MRLEYSCGNYSVTRSTDRQLQGLSKVDDSRIHGRCVLGQSLRPATLRPDHTCSIQIFRWVCHIRFPWPKTLIRPLFFQVRCGMPLGNLISFFAPGAVDLLAFYHCRARCNFLSPADEVRVFMHRQELGSRINLVAHQRAIPWPHGDISNRIRVARQVVVFRQATVQHVELTFGLHRKPVDGVLELLGRIRIKMPEPAAQIRRSAHLPEQPVQGLGTSCRIGRQERGKLLRQIQQNRSGFEHPHRRLMASVQQRRDFRVGIDLDKAAGKLLTLGDANQPRVVFRSTVSQRQQLLQHDRDLHPIGRRQRIQLQRMLADGQFLFMCRTGDRAVDAGKCTA